MSINLDIVIDSPEPAIDMKAGLDTLQGVSEATRYIAETLLTDRLVQRQSHKSKVRTKLKQSFKGSYGHVFSLEIYDEELKRKFNRIGREIFSEIMSYFISESLYLESENLSDKAQKIIDKLGDVSENLIKQLRISSLENIHEISRKFNHNVVVNYRKSINKKTIIAKFDKTTAKALEAKESDKKITLTVSINRLNIFTGNGRLLIKGEDETVAFGFGIKYVEVRLEAKKKFSENLDHNNGLDREKWKYLKIEVRSIELRDGKIIKYIVTGIYNE